MISGYFSINFLQQGEQTYLRNNLR